MFTYIELWKAKQSWLELSKDERANYMNALGPAIAQLIAGGAQIVSWGYNESSTFCRADYDFFGVWNFPDRDAALGFEKMVEGAGWYHYFDQVNAMGAAGGPQESIAMMIVME
jgi:hypothetical protein